MKNGRYTYWLIGFIHKSDFATGFAYIRRVFGARIECYREAVAVSSEGTTREGRFRALPIGRGSEQASCLKTCKTYSSGSSLVHWCLKAATRSSLL